MGSAHRENNEAGSVCVFCIDPMNDFYLMYSIAHGNTFVIHHFGLSFPDSYGVFLLER